jgi:hypothetical protein
MEQDDGRVFSGHVLDDIERAVQPTVPCQVWMMVPFEAAIESTSIEVDIR